MTDQVVAVATPAPRQARVENYVDWPAIFAGVLIAAAISFILLTFGAALGLTVSDTFGGGGMSITMYVVAIGLWLVWVQVSSVMAGAYITGRLRHRVNDATEHEVNVRDGAHGLVVWAVATVLGAWLSASTLASGVATGAKVAGSSISSIVSGTGIGSRGNRIDSQAFTRNATAYSLDVLFRPGPGEARAPGASAVAPARQGSNSGVTSEARNEVMRMLAAAGVAGDISDADKAYIASTVSRETGIDETAAKQRVDQFIKARNEAIDKARTFADKARKMGVILAFITAVSLLLAAAGGWWAATMGGAHRDEETVIPLLLWRK